MFKYWTGITSENKVVCVRVLTILSFSHVAEINCVRISPPMTKRFGARDQKHKVVMHACYDTVPTAYVSSCFVALDDMCQV